MQVLPFNPCIFMQQYGKSGNGLERKTKKNKNKNKISSSNFGESSGEMKISRFTWLNSNYAQN